MVKRSRSEVVGESRGSVAPPHLEYTHAMLSGVAGVPIQEKARIRRRSVELIIEPSSVRLGFEVPIEVAEVVAPVLRSILLRGF